MEVGASCTLYKQCRICYEIKYKTKFPRRSKKNFQRRPYCKRCNPNKDALFYEPADGYSFETSLLSKTLPIEIHGINPNDHLYRSEISYEKAIVLVEEGAASIVYHNPGRGHPLSCVTVL